MTRRPVLSAAVALVSAALAAGCSGAGVAEPVRTTAVTMAKSYRFTPRTIEVEAGATVTWTNEDNFTHTVKVDGRSDHHVERDKSVSIRFDRPGTYHYTCTLHPHDMDGEVIVR